MTLEKNFLKKETQKLNISPKKFAIGLLIGTIYSFTFYALLYMTREIMRIISLTEDYNIWTLSDEETEFYNLFFSFIAVILGQSICFAFWIDKPKKVFSNFRFRRNTVLNDQRVLVWYFLNVFSRFAIAFGFIYGFGTNGWFECIDIYASYKYIFVFIIIVLFLQTWNTLLLEFKRKAYVWMIYSALIVSLLSFGYSKINLVNIKTFNREITKNRIDIKYHYELPKSTVYKKYENNYLNNIFFIVRDKKNNTPLYIFNKKEFRLDNLTAIIEESRKYKHPMEIPYLTYELRFDANIKISTFINTIKRFIQHNANNIRLAVTPMTPNKSKILNKGLVMKMSYAQYRSDFKEDIGNYDKVTNIEFIKHDSIKLNNHLINDVIKIKTTIKKQFQQKKKNLFLLKLEEPMHYSNYIFLISTIKKAINELRDDYALKKYSRSFNNLNSEEKTQVNNSYQFQILNE